MLQEIETNRVGTGAGTRPPHPLNHTPYPYRMKEHSLPDSIDKIQQTNEQPDYVGGDAIWLMDTISMPIVRLTAIKHANKEIERRWSDYSFQPPWRINRCEHEEQFCPEVERSKVSEDG